MKLAAKIVFVVVVYKALSSHEERPAYISRPFSSQAEAEEEAQSFPGLSAFRPRVFKLRDGNGLERLYKSLEAQGRTRESDREAEDPR